MPASVPTSTEFDALNQRVSTLSSTVDGQGTQLASQQNSLAALTARVAALENGNPPNPTAPPAPTGLTAVINHTARTVALTWNSVPQADGYRVLADGVSVSAIVTGTTITADGLSYGPHTFAVAARRSGVWSLYSPAIAATLVDPGTPPTGRLIYATDFTNMNDLLGYNPRDDGYFQQVGGALTQTTDPNNPSNKVLKAEINGGGSRAEAIPAGAVAQTDIQEGDDRWFQFRLRLAANYPRTSSWQLAKQWKQGSTQGSPPIELDPEDGVWRLAGGESDPRGFRGWRLDLAPLVVDVWVTWLFHIKFSSDPNVGVIDAWKDGVQVITNSRGAQRNNAGTMYPGQHSYPKCGYYRNTAIGTKSHILWDYDRMGDSRSSVEF